MEKLKVFRKGALIKTLIILSLTAPLLFGSQPEEIEVPQLIMVSDVRDIRVTRREAVNYILGKPEDRLPPERPPVILIGDEEVAKYLFEQVLRIPYKYTLRGIVRDHGSRSVRYLGTDFRVVRYMEEGRIGILSGGMHIPRSSEIKVIHINE